MLRQEKLTQDRLNVQRQRKLLHKFLLQLQSEFSVILPRYILPC